MDPGSGAGMTASVEGLGEPNPNPPNSACSDLFPKER